MEPSPSETSSESVDLEKENLKLHNDELMEMLKWNAAIVTVLLEQAGGVAEVSAEDLQRIDLSKANATVEYDSARDVYVIKGVYEDAV